MYTADRLHTAEVRTVMPAYGTNYSVSHTCATKLRIQLQEVGTRCVPGATLEKLEQWPRAWSLMDKWQT